MTIDEILKIADAVALISHAGSYVSENERALVKLADVYRALEQRLQTIEEEGTSELSAAVALRQALAQERLRYEALERSVPAKQREAWLAACEIGIGEFYWPEAQADWEAEALRRYPDLSAAPPKEGA